MFPIYEQGKGRGKGLGLETFLTRFDQICAKHVREHRAKAFAFIFYDSQDAALKRILKDEGVFTKLDRLVGTELSVFFLYASSTERELWGFNRMFLSKLGLDDVARPPCVVFFDFNDGTIQDVTVAELEHANIVHGFHELYEVLQRYIVDRNAPSASGGSLKWMRGAAKFIGLEVFRAALAKGAEKVF